MRSLWPDETQTLLLHAALDPGESALVAFDSWQARIDIADHLDPGSFRLLPLLHANLKRLGCIHPLMGRLSGVFRHSWTRLQGIMHDARDIVAICESAGIPTMVNKGLALGLCYYDNPAHRPMSDIDLIVPLEKVEAAVAALNSNGWRVARGPRRNWQDVVLYRHSIGFLNEQERELDLHWALSGELNFPDAERRFWGNAVPMEVLGVPTLRPGATDMLLHTALHGVRFNRMPPLRWIADFATILRKEGAAVQWGDMLAFAERSRVLTRLGIALEYLRDEMRLAIPDHVVAAARDARPGIVERMENWAALSDGESTVMDRIVKPRQVAAIARMVGNRQASQIPRVMSRWLARELRKKRRKAYASFR